jgi:dynein heavy chain
MSPMGEVFADNLRRFPSLVNCCTIDWYSNWPSEALFGVGRGQLMEDAPSLHIQDNLKEVVRIFCYQHKSVEKYSEKYLAELGRANFVTPTSYLELLALFKLILKEKQKALQIQINRLESGLNKLASANA